MKTSEQADLSTLNTFKVAARARYLAVASSVNELSEALEFAGKSKMPVCILGGGSNTLFVGDFPGLVLQVNLQGRATGKNSKGSSNEITLGGGENWHAAVEYCLGKGLYGLENLALIPGAAGAAPIQNIGAYGVELQSFFYCLEAMHQHSGQQRVFYKDDCGFAYRHSVFKETDNPWIVLSLTLHLHKESRPDYSYPALAESLTAAGFSQDSNGRPITSDAIFDTVCRLRRSKLPDPAELGNAGSFFKNPVVLESQFEELKGRYGELPGYSANPALDANPNKPAKVKIPAGWLLEQLGWKGQLRGAAGVHERHALVLVNHGGASGHDILNLAQEMQASVQDTFGISLQPEVCIVEMHSRYA